MISRILTTTIDDTTDSNNSNIQRSRRRRRRRISSRKERSNRVLVMMIMMMTSTLMPIVSSSFALLITGGATSSGRSRHGALFSSIIQHCHRSTGNHIYRNHNVPRRENNSNRIPLPLPPPQHTTVWQQSDMTKNIYWRKRTLLFSSSSSSSSSSNDKLDDLMDNMDQLLQTELNSVANKNKKSNKKEGNQNNNTNNNKNDTDDNTNRKKKMKNIEETAKRPFIQWKTIDWETLSSDSNQEINQERSSSFSISSPVETYNIYGRKVYVKRDDVLKLYGSNISGNKARKMLSLNNYISSIDFPSVVVSYGGPQSNAMLALAAIVNYKNRELQQQSRQQQQQKQHQDSSSSSSNEKTKNKIRFVYYTKKLPKFLRQSPSGNYYRAITLGMELIEVTNDEYNNLFVNDWGGNPTPPPQSLMNEELASFLMETSSSSLSSSSSSSLDLTTTTASTITNNDKNDGRTVVSGDGAIDALWIPQGGAFAMAVAGARQQAQEIYTFWKNVCETRQHERHTGLTVCVPGGTCSSAVLLHRELRKLTTKTTQQEQQQRKELNAGTNPNTKSEGDDDARDDLAADIRVVVVPCVGDDAYARRQMMSLSTQVGGTADDIPTVLSPSPLIDDGSSSFGQIGLNDLLPPEMQRSMTTSEEDSEYLTFGEPDEKILETFQMLRRDHDLVLDLLYGAPSWTIMLRHWNSDLPSSDVEFDPYHPLAGREIMYVHSGGLEGINSQLLRYKYKGLVSIEDIQIP